MQKINSQLKGIDTRKKLHVGKMQQQNEQENYEQSAEMVQCRIRGILARKQIEKMREEEMIFLGMKRKPKTDDEKKNNPLLTAEETRKDRKAIQEAHWETFVKEKKELINTITEIEGDDIADTMMKERRDWIQQFRADFNKVPDGLEKFYERHNLQEPLTAEEEEKKAAEEEEKGKKGKDKKAKGKKGKGKGGDKGDDEPKTMKIGPSEVVGKFDEFYEEYNKDWANRDERENKQ